MFVFGHIGIGRALLGRWRAQLPAVALIAGMLLPDLIDKPLFYAGLSPYISCTRTFGHTGLLLLALVGAAYFYRSRTLTALAAGDATHLLLDLLLDFPDSGWAGASWVALTWPLAGTHFAPGQFTTVGQHLLRLQSLPVVLGEVVGVLLIGWELWRGKGTSAGRDGGTRERGAEGPS